VLARLFSKPANLLVLDEPTNDLDIETLELLEEILLSFDGTVLLVSHDREFMDNVVTSLLVVEGNGVVSEHAGGYSDWLARGGRLVESGGQGDRVSATGAPIARDAPAQAPKTKKLSYKEQRELGEMPGLIETLEQRQQALEATMAAPDFYQRGHRQTQEVIAQLATVQAELEAAFARWAELDG
jgi:ATP-binding cassette subfamily F protein uup